MSSICAGLAWGYLKGARGISGTGWRMGLRRRSGGSGEYGERENSSGYEL